METFLVVKLEEPVNSLLYSFLLFLCLGMSGCGFQLNRNQAQLPNQATSLGIKTENKTFTSGIDIQLKKKLIQTITTRSEIQLFEPGDADLVLYLEVIKIERTRNELSVTNDNQQNYEYKFSTDALLTVTDNRAQSILFEKFFITGVYTLEKIGTELTEFEKIDGSNESLENLADSVFQLLTEQF